MEPLIIEKIEDEVLELVKKMKQYSKMHSDTSMAIIKSIRVYPNALIETIEEFLRDVTDSTAQKSLKGVAISLKNMVSDGRTKMLSYVSEKSSDISHFGYLCAAVRKYKYKGEDVIDFAVTSCSFKVQISETGSYALAKTVQIGSDFCAAIAAKIGTGTMARAIAAVADITATVAKSLQPEEIFRTASGTGKLPENYKQILHACFIYDLQASGYAEVTADKELRITEN